MIITEAYRQQQKELHETNEHYGQVSVAFAPIVAKAINSNGVREVLDYGAGKCALIKEITESRLVDHKFEYYPYEPADERYSAVPEPREMVVCLDVLEHIEHDCLDNVLDDLARVTLSLGFFTVCTVAAKKILADGRNAHLIQKPAEWWLPRLMDRMELHSFQRIGNNFAVFMKPYV